MLRTKLLVTDDSFEFNRVLGRLKAIIAALPVVTADDEREVQARCRRLFSTAVTHSSIASIVTCYAW